MTEPIEREAKEQKEIVRPNQAEVSYTTLSAEAGRACANCRWFDGHQNYCHLIENYPSDILATGYCERWEAPPEMATPEEAMTIQADSVTVVEMGEMGEMEAKEAEEGGVVNTIRHWKDRLLRAHKDKPLLEPGQHSGFKVFQRNGQDYWVAWWSNDFQDREKEIIERAAHDRYIARLDAGFTPLPKLWYWHVKGTDHGEALWVDRVEHLMIAVGKFDDTPRAQKFIRHYRKAKRYGVSHGFTYPKWALQDGVYADYNTFEISPLPHKAAANLYTGFDEVKIMAMNDEKRNALIAIVGEEAASEIINETDKASKALEELGLTFKDFSDIPGAKETANTDDGQPLMGKMLLAMITAQGELIEKQTSLETQLADALKAFSKTQETLTANNQALQAENASLKQEQALAPRASQSEATVTEDAKLKQAMAAKVSDNDNFWGELAVPKEQVSS